MLQILERNFSSFTHATWIFLLLRSVVHGLQDNSSAQTRPPSKQLTFLLHKRIARVFHNQLMLYALRKRASLASVMLQQHITV